MSILNPKEPGNEFSCFDDRPDNNGYHAKAFDERDGWGDDDEIEEEETGEDIENDLENIG